MEFHDLMNDAEFNFHYQEYCNSMADAECWDVETPEQLEYEAAARYAEALVEEMDAMEARGGPRFDIYGAHDEIPF